MQIHCFNIERAIAHLEKSSDENALHFINVLKEHAVDQDIRITFGQGNLVSMTFTSTHEVDEEIDAGESIIIIHSVDNSATATVTPIFSPEAKTMNTEQTASSTTTQQTAATQPAQTQKPVDNALALKIGKVVLYTAGAAATVAAGVWAWKKWGSSSSSTTV